MRVIAGRYKGKRLVSPTDKRVRPTADRIKETMFNILLSRGGLYGRALDLFSGSGALGLEALSRGCEYAVFADKDPDSVRLTKRNLTNAGAEGYVVYNADWRVALERVKGGFDFIFLDPPYALRIEAELVSRIDEYRLLNENGTIIIEHDVKNKLPFLPETFIIDTRECGNTALSFLSRR